MSMFRVTQDSPRFETDETGWDHRAWMYEITGLESGAWFRGTYKAGMGINPASVTGDEILESVARDIEMATDYWTAEPTVRTLIGQLHRELGYDDPVVTYGIAVQLMRVCKWFDRLTTGESEEIWSLAEDEDE